MVASAPPDRARRLGKSDRLRTPEDYGRVTRQGRRSSGERFTVIVAAGEPGRNRLGITIPRGVGSAVLRNRLRRLIREYFRLNRDLFPTSGDVVVMARPGVGWLYLRDMTEIASLLRKAASRAAPRSR